MPLWTNLATASDSLYAKAQPPNCWKFEVVGFSAIEVREEIAVPPLTRPCRSHPSDIVAVQGFSMHIPSHEATAEAGVVCPQNPC